MRADGGSSPSTPGPCVGVSVSVCIFLSVCVVVCVHLSIVLAETTHKQILLSSFSFYFCDLTSPHLLLASRIVWIFLLFVEEGFSLSQKIKGKIIVFTILF